MARYEYPGSVQLDIEHYRLWILETFSTLNGFMPDVLSEEMQQRFEDFCDSAILDREQNDWLVEVYHRALVGIASLPFVKIEFDK